MEFHDKLVDILEKGISLTAEEIQELNLYFNIFDIIEKEKVAFGNFLLSNLRSNQLNQVGDWDLRNHEYFRKIGVCESIKRMYQNQQDINIALVYYIEGDGYQSEFPNKWSDAIKRAKEIVKEPKCHYVGISNIEKMTIFFSTQEFTEMAKYYNGWFQTEKDHETFIESVYDCFKTKKPQTFEFNKINQNMEYKKPNQEYFVGRFLRSYDKLNSRTIEPTIKSILKEFKYDENDETNINKLKNYLDGICNENGYIDIDDAIVNDLIEFVNNQLNQNMNVFEDQNFINIQVIDIESCLHHFDIFEHYQPIIKKYAVDGYVKSTDLWNFLFSKEGRKISQDVFDYLAKTYGYQYSSDLNQSNSQNIDIFYKAAQFAAQEGLIKSLVKDGIDEFHYYHKKDECQVTIFEEDGLISMTQDYLDGKFPYTDDISLSGFKKYLEIEDIYQDIDVYKNTMFREMPFGFADPSNSGMVGQNKQPIYVIRFTENDYGKLVSEEFYSIKNGKIWDILKEKDDRLVGSYDKDKSILKVIDTDLSEWLKDNSYSYQLNESVEIGQKYNHSKYGYGIVIKPSGDERQNEVNFKPFDSKEFLGIKHHDSRKALWNGESQSIIVNIDDLEKTDDLNQSVKVNSAFNNNLNQSVSDILDNYYNIAKQSNLIKDLFYVSNNEFNFYHKIDKCEVTVSDEDGTISILQDYNDDNMPEWDDISLNGFAEYLGIKNLNQAKIQMSHNQIWDNMPTYNREKLLSKIGYDGNMKLSLIELENSGINMDYFLELLEKYTKNNYKLDQAKMKQIELPNSNITVLGFGNDINGNKVIKLKYPNSQAFSFQVGSFDHLRFMSRFDLNDVENDSDKVEKALVSVIKEFGSKKQKEGLRTYSGFSENLNESESSVGDKFLNTTNDTKIEIVNIDNDGWIYLEPIGNKKGLKNMAEPIEPNQFKRFIKDGAYKRLDESLSKGQFDLDGILKSVDNFLTKFPDNATSWRQATDDIVTLYNHLEEEYNSITGKDLDAINPSNTKTPDGRNKEYKKGIYFFLELMKKDPKFDDALSRFYESYKGWFGVNQSELEHTFNKL